MLIMQMDCFAIDEHSPHSQKIFPSFNGFKVNTPQVHKLLYTLKTLLSKQSLQKWQWLACLWPSRTQILL